MKKKKSNAELNNGNKQEDSSEEIKSLYEMIKEKEDELNKAFKARTLYLDEIEKLKHNISELTKSHTKRIMDDYEVPIPNSPNLNTKKKEIEKRLEDTELQLLESERNKDVLNNQISEIQTKFKRLNYEHEKLQVQAKTEVEDLKTKIVQLQAVNSNLNKANKRNSNLPVTPTLKIEDLNSDNDLVIHSLTQELEKFKEKNLGHKEENKKLKEYIENQSLKYQKLKQQNTVLIEIQKQYEILKATLERQSIRISDHHRSSIFSFLSPRSSTSSISGSKNGTLRSDLQPALLSPSQSNQSNSPGLSSNEGGSIGRNSVLLNRSGASKRTLLSELQMGFYEDFSTTDSQDEIVTWIKNNPHTDEEEEDVKSKGKERRNVIIRVLKYIYNLLYKWTKFLFLILLSVIVAIYRGPDSPVDYF